LNTLSLLEEAGVVRMEVLQAVVVVLEDTELHLDLL
jgi:hypothetical protein